MSILPYKNIHPQLDPSVFVADTATVIGDTHIGKNSSVWFSAVIRGDVMPIRIGEGTNVQDGAVIHVTQGKIPCAIGNGVTIGHRAVIHGCTIGDRALVGMGAVVLDEAIVQPDAFVAAGSLVSPGKVVESGWLWAGIPARPVRKLRPDELAYLSWSGPHYVEVSRQYMPVPLKA